MRDFLEREAAALGRMTAYVVVVPYLILSVAVGLIFEFVRAWHVHVRDRLAEG